MTVVEAQGARRRAPRSRLAPLGDALMRHARLIRAMQWVVVAVYLLLLVVPVLLPLPDRAAHIWSNVVLFAQFAFWGLWWPFVLLSMVLVGRAWCGLFCPEGALAEVMSEHGRGFAVPRWIRWRGWPFVAFAGTTVYGQLVSVYQYPRPVLVVLGGSTAAAMLVGYLYGRSKRVWCRYLCPVNGVFGLLAKLAPVHFRVDPAGWEASRRAGNAAVRSVNCAPLVALPTMRGNHDCHMCGRCSGFRNAIELDVRPPNAEIVAVAGATPRRWETILLTYGLMGIAVGAFHWNASPYFVAMKQASAEWLVDHDVTWPLTIEPPWWILTHNPDGNDVMTLLDGTLICAYIAITALIFGGALNLAVAAGTRALGAWSTARFHHLAQALIPIAGCGVFLGLSAVTVTMLHGDGWRVAWVGPLRAVLLIGATTWSVWLGHQVAATYTRDPVRRAGATCAVGLAAAIGAASWVLLFWVW